MTVNRKEFVVLLVSAAAAPMLPGCGGGDSSGGGGFTGGCRADISANHGHALSIPRADLDSTTARTYSIQGSADHAHSVTFSAAQLATLKAGQSVSVASTQAVGHEHTVTPSC